MTTTKTDSELWRRVAKGHTAAFSELYDRHAQAVGAYCLWRTGDPDAAEEVTSTVFLEVWRKRETLQLQIESAKPLLIGVANNVIRQQWRTQRRHREALKRIQSSVAPTPSSSDDSDERVDAQNRLNKIRLQLKAMPDKEREVLVAVALSDLSYEEAAVALEIPVGTVRSRMSRARTRLTEPSDLTQSIDEINANSRQSVSEVHA